MDLPQEIVVKILFTIYSFSEKNELMLLSMIGFEHLEEGSM